MYRLTMNIVALSILGATVIQYAEGWHCQRSRSIIPRACSISVVAREGVDEIIRKS